MAPSQTFVTRGHFSRLFPHQPHLVPGIPDSKPQSSAYSLPPSHLLGGLVCFKACIPSPETCELLSPSTCSAELQF